MQSALRDDALTARDGKIVLRVGLPWIRSLPLACISDFAVQIDGQAIENLEIELGERRVRSDQLLDEDGWWYLQDRVVLVGDGPLQPGEHDVAVSFRVTIPYLLAGPGGGALQLPLSVARRLEVDHATVPSVSLDVA